MKFTYVCIYIHIYNIQTCKITMVYKSIQAIQSHTDGIHSSSKDSKSKSRNLNLISNICVLKIKRQIHYRITSVILASLRCDGKKAGE